jgi:prepilin-type N-terminal cleavage/methylation domain-containing protein
MFKDICYKNKGFTLIELIVVIAVIGVLSAIILFSVTQYINRGKDSNIAASLVVLIPAGEVYYNSASAYSGFCSSDAFKNTLSQMPTQSSDAPCYNSTTNPAGVCCDVASDGQSWAACAREFTNNSKAFCVDSRGIKREIQNSLCTNFISQCP